MLPDSGAFSVIWYSEETEFQKCVLFGVLYDVERPAQSQCNTTSEPCRFD